MDIQQNNVAVLHFNLVNQDGSTIFIRKTKLATFNLINPSEVSVPITDIGFDATLNQCWVRVPKESNAATGQYYGVLNIVDDDWGTYTTSKIKVYSVVSDADEDTKSVVFTATCIATQVTNPSGGNSPYYNTTTGTWWQYSDTLKAFEDTGVGNPIKYITKDATFKGVATPETTPGTPDDHVFYIASTPGTYANFGGIVISAKGLYVLSNTTGSWVSTPNLIDSKLDKQIGKNLFNKNASGIIDGQYLDSEGGTNANALYFISDYIPVSPNTTYTHTNFDLGGARACIYDANKVFVSSFQSGTIATPVNGYFIRMSGTVANKDIQQLEAGSSYTGYVAYIDYLPLQNLQDQIDDLSVDITDRLAGKLDAVPGKNLFNPNDPNILVGYFINDGGGYFSNSYGINTSGWIPISSGQSLKANFGVANTYVALYDANKNYVAGSAVNANVINWQTGAVYARFSYCLPVNNYQIEVGTVSTTYEPYTGYYPIEALQNLLQSEIDVVNDTLVNKLDKVAGKNKYDPQSWVEGQWVADDGSIQSVGYGIGRSGYIPISSGQTLTAYQTDFFSQCRACLYDVDKNPIVASVTTDAMATSRSITWQTGAVYAVFTFRSSPSEEKKSQIELGNSFTFYESYTYASIEASQIPDRETVCVLPSKMYFVKGKQSCIYHENVLFKNLQDPTTLYLDKGTNYNRQTTLNFATAATSQTLKAQVIRSFKRGQLKAITYDVIDPLTNNGKTVNALHIGDSFTDIGSWVKETKNLMNAQGVTYNLIGTCGDSTFRAEGLSGGNLANTFLNNSSGVGRRVQVTGVTTLPSTGYPGRTYRDANGKDWTIRSGKVDSNGNGYVVVTKFGAIESDFNNFPTAGILTKQDTGEGDAIINYSNPTACYFNPFINPSTGVLDLSNYIDTWGLNVPNLVLFQFTWNDTGLWDSDTNISNLVTACKSAADHVHSEYPSAKVMFSIEPFGSINGNKDWNGKKYTVLRLMELLLIQFEDDANYNTWVKIAPSYAFVDLINGYCEGTVAPCERYLAINERSGGDGVHPNTGMLQIADCVSQIVSAII